MDYHYIKITSKSTFVLPLLALSICSFWFAFYFIDKYGYAVIGSELKNNNLKYYTLLILLATGMGFLFYKFFFKTILKTNFKYFRFSLLFIPAIFIAILDITIKGEFSSYVDTIIGSILLYFTFSLFVNRYTAYLTEDAIEYKNLIGQSGIICLRSITKLEQKKSVFSVLKGISILNMAMKTGITFCDAELNEYEINIYTKTFDNSNTFKQIIASANQCDNFKIRQYTF